MYQEIVPVNPGTAPAYPGTDPFVPGTSKPMEIDYVSVEMMEIDRQCSLSGKCLHGRFLGRWPSAGG
jgi:hypothetical protein